MVTNQSKNIATPSLRSIVCQDNKIKYIIKSTQREMASLKEKLSSYEPFSNNVTPSDCVDRLVAHRIVSKFHIADSARDAVLTTSAYHMYRSEDMKLPTEINPWSYHVLVKARKLLHSWFRNFSVDIADLEWEPTPGETYVSSGGEVSLTAKLLLVEHWTTTANCLEETCVFIYNHLAFKRAARQHIKAVGTVTRKVIRSLRTKFLNKADLGYQVFRHLLINHVLTIVDGARGTTVSKNNKQRRFINVEALFPVILQRAAAFVFKKVLKRQGNDLGNDTLNLSEDHIGIITNIGRSAQDLHARMIAHAHYATIDFANASNSVTVAAVRALFPPQVYDYLFKTRSHFVAIEGELYEPNMLSSMGNGFTFEVMTSMLYAIAKVLTDDCRVYGDDVIIPNEFAPRFIKACDLISFKVNDKKTFVNSFFRESCGAFYDGSTNSYVTSYDFNPVEELSDVITTCNKLTLIINQSEVSDDLKLLLESTRDRIAVLVHASRKGPLPVSASLRKKFLSSYVYDINAVKKQRRSKELVTLRKRYIEKNKEFFKDYQLETDDWSLVMFSFFVPSASQHLFSNNKGLDVLLPALYSGVRLKATRKGKGVWKNVPAFVSSCGDVMLISNLIRSKRSKVWVPKLSGVVITPVSS